MLRHTRIALAALVATALVIPLAASAVTPTFTSERGFITSFDGTPIVYNLFLPAGASASHQVPVILRTHGWGGKGETASGLSGTAQAFLNADYAVLTWDSRGFGASGGEANVDDPTIEGKDASALIDLVAGRSEIAKTAPGDPVMGMSGGSYAGGIQLATAAYDSRVDAIAPEITWNDLRYALFPHDVVKFGWTQLLFAGGLAAATKDGVDQNGTAGIQTGSYSPGILQGEALGLALGFPDPITKSFFEPKGVAGYGAAHPIAIPTLLMQGDVDTLFNLNDAWANFQHISGNGAPAKLITFCGGHVACPANVNSGSARSHLDAAILTWFDKYLRGNVAANTGAPVEYSTEDGAWHDASTFPTVSNPGPASFETATGSGTLVSLGASTDGGGSGASYYPIVTDGYSSDPGTLSVPVFQATAATTVVGIPHLSLTVSGAGAGAHLFFKLVDRESKAVLDGQAESLRLEGPLTGATQTFSLDLVGVSALVAAGHHVDLQISTSSLAHVQHRGSAVLNITATVQVPTV